MHTQPNPITMIVPATLLSPSVINAEAEPAPEPESIPPDVGPLVLRLSKYERGGGPPSPIRHALHTPPSLTPPKKFSPIP